METDRQTDTHKHTGWDQYRSWTNSLSQMTVNVSMMIWQLEEQKQQQRPKE